MNGPNDQTALDSIIAGFFAWQPQPHVLAVNEHGVPVPVPAAVPVAPDRRIEGVVSAFELCLLEDNAAIIEAFINARQRGGGRATVHLHADPQTAVQMHILDARSRYDVFLVFLVSPNVSIGSAPKSTLLRPRCFVIERDQFGVIVNVDEAVEKILGWNAAEFIGQRTTELIHPADRSAALGAWMILLARPNAEASGLYRYRHRDGSYVWIEATNTNLLDDPGVGRVRSQMVNVSDRMAALEALREKEELLRRLTDALPVGIAQTDGNGQIVYRNERWTEILGCADAVSIESQFASADGAGRAALLNALGRLTAGEALPDLEIALDVDGGRRRCGIAFRPLCAPDDSITGAILCVTDITENSRLREELERRATFDSLTECRNRSSIIETLKVMLEPNRNDGFGVAALFIDLDGFKQINDEIGHAAGDELLRCVSRRLLETARAHDIVGRLGGDEFLVLCPHVDSAADALAIAGRLHAAIQAPAELKMGRIVPGASIGVAWTNTRITADTLVAEADEAMYEAKRSKSGPVLSGKRDKAADGSRLTAG